MMPMAIREYTDEELIQLLQVDGEKAIDLIFRRYYQYLCYAVYRVIPDRNLVEDLAQEVFFELWRKRTNLEIKTSLKAYLRRAAVNRSLNYIRDQKIKFDDREELPDVERLRVVQPRIMEEAELKRMIEAAVKALPERCRIIFSLSRYEEMSYQEIADNLNISVKTVENQISKALKLLKLAIEPYTSLALLSIIWQIFG